MRHTGGLVVALATLWGCAGDDARDDAGSLGSLGTTVPVDDPAADAESGDDGAETDPSAGESGADDGATTGTDDLPEFDPSFALAQVDAALAAGVPGLAIAIVYDGEVVLAEGFGVADEQGTMVDATTLFNLASVSKMITALAVLSARDEGLVTLDAPVPTVVPEFVLREGFDASSVQIRHLLTHSAGLGDWPTEPYVPGYTLVDEFAGNPNQPLWFTPGTIFDYSNRGFTLAGLVAARLHGGSFADAVATRVLAPFGMDGATVDAAVAQGRVHARGNSSWDGGWVGPAEYIGEWYQPVGGLWASADDLGGLLEALANRDAPGFAAGTLDEMQSPVQPTHEFPGAAYGYGLFVDGGDPAIVHHGGSTGGYLADLQVMPARGFGVAIVVNGDTWYPSQAGYAIVEHYAGTSGFPDVPDPIDPASFPGTYDDPWQLGGIEVVATDTGLQASFTDFGQTVELTPLWGAVFSCAHPVDGGPLDLLFWPDGAGNTSHLVSRAGVAARLP